MAERQKRAHGIKIESKESAYAQAVDDEARVCVEPGTDCGCEDHARWVTKD